MLETRTREQVSIDPASGAAAPSRTPDQLETDLLACEQLIGQLRAYQARLLGELRELEVFRSDGSRSMRDWTAAKLDVTHDTSRALLAAAKAGELLEDVSFDRAVATARLVAAGGADAVEWSRRLDIAGVRRLVAHRRRLTRISEEEANQAQRLRVYPNFDKSQYQLSGTLGPVGGRIMEQFLDRLADNLPNDDILTGREQRQAAGLVAHAEDYLQTTPNPDHDSEGGGDGGLRSVGVVNVHVDATLAGDTRGEAGGEIEFGPRIGPLTLEELLCRGQIRVIVTKDNQPVAASHATRHIPPHIRAHVTKRDGGCTIAGCSSRYRLEPHHITPWADGGTHDPDNLTTLCWYHHHIAIHQHGQRLDPNSPPQNRTLQPRRRRAPPNLE
jgi:hypothetical protein